MSLPEVTVAIVTYNGMKVLPLCLESVLKQSYTPIRIIVVDNASTDGTPNWVRNNYPHIEVVEYPKNNGPNPARNTAIRLSHTDLILLVDDDAVLEQNCLEGLIQAYQRFPNAAVWSPRIMYYQQQEIIQWDGAFLHYLEVIISLNGEKHLKECPTEITPMQLAGGVAELISKEKALAVGMFDEYLFFGQTDAESSYRLGLAGYKIYAVPNAICYHQVKKRGLTKVFYQMRNRWYFILSSYAGKTIFLLVPAFVLYEISLLGFLIMKGTARTYFEALCNIISDLPKVLANRRKVQKLRKVQDRKLLHCGPINIRSDLVENKIEARVKAILDTIFHVYWRLVKGLL